MAYKFKVGDRVKVVKVVGDYSEDNTIQKFVGRCGVVQEHDGGIWPYKVRFRSKNNELFSTCELKAAPAVKKKVKKKGK